MPFVRPPLEEILERVDAELVSRLALGSLLRRSVLGALARVLAGSSHLLHGHLDWIARQVLPDTAELEHLERWAAVWGVGRKPASAWSGMALFAGSTGSTVPAGTKLQRDDGTEYETQEDGTLVGGEASVPIAALEVGAGPNIEAGAVLALTSPVPGVQPTATVLEEELADGAEVESDEDLRARVLERIQEPPHGGTQQDYPAWCLEVPGVTRAWAFPLHLGPGTVGVTIASDDAPDGPIPEAGLVSAVQAYIDERRPVTAAVTVYAPIPREIVLQIELSPDSLELRAAVEASLSDLIRREAAPGSTLLVSHLREAISTTPGETDHELQLIDDEVPGDLEIDASELGILGEIVWV